MLGATFAYASQLASGAASIWFISWAIRRRYEIDCQLTRKEQVIRWSVVAAGFVLAFLQGGEFEIVRIVAGVLALAFLAWPNFARSVADLVRTLYGADGR
jgi:hypothetical protein